MGDILLGPCPYKLEVQHMQARRQLHPYMSQLMGWIGSWNSFGVNLGITMLRTEKDAVKITDGRKMSFNDKCGAQSVQLV